MIPKSLLISGHGRPGRLIALLLGGLAVAGGTVLVGLADLVVEAREAPLERPATVVHRPPTEDVAVERGEDGTWEVLDRRVARVANLNDLTNPDALDYLHDRLKRMGVDRALARAGVREGEGVRIGRLEFTYEEG